MPGHGHASYRGWPDLGLPAASLRGLSSRPRQRPEAPLAQGRDYAERLAAPEPDPEGVGAPPRPCDEGSPDMPNAERLLQERVALGSLEGLAREVPDTHSIGPDPMLDQDAGIVDDAVAR